MKYLFFVFPCLILAGCQRKEEALSLPRDKKDPRERLVAVKELAVCGPDAEGVIPTLILALDDDDPSVKGFAAVALISFGEKARQALKKRTDELWEKNKEKMAEAVKLTQGAGTSAPPNPIKVPENRLAPVDFLVDFDPWFAGTLEPMSRLALKDEEPDIRAIGARALGFLEVDRTSPNSEVVEALKASRDDPHEKVRSAAEQALKLLRK